MGGGEHSDGLWWERLAAGWGLLGKVKMVSFSWESPAMQWDGYWWTGVKWVRITVGWIW